MNRLAKVGLAVGGAVAAVGALRRVLEPRPRYAPWEKPPYREFPNKVLVLGVGSADTRPPRPSAISSGIGRTSG
ncbi:MAG: hypothetical protein AVDCRST_MAG78-1839 [uncultured Rubrobacteraceae bacterium]|uniref:Uncharacterized protein n=1 Tax=uncultured Rubrobacteraceae bacterium TaxID=349277 RepID=A0A6J4Q7Y8_9ACTN|nr:MAG: hypothetical protein AVDCRST_MAG78-1839 [uncultured Rubrobacteraceae bacterium]